MTIFGKFFSEHRANSKAAFMRRWLIMLFVAAQVCTACRASANQNVNTPLDNPVLAVIGIELGLALNAKLVSSNPNEVGKIMALFGIPYAIALTQSEDSESAKWIVPLVTAAYAAYYINLDEDKKSETEIFQENMIGMNAIFAIGLASGYLLGTDEKNAEFNSNYSSEEQAAFIGFYPLVGGGQFLLMHRF